MAGSRESQFMRPQSQHRLSASSTSSSNFPIRHQASRHHSHSVSLGTVNPTHRVTRRKSMTSTAASSAAAIAAAIGSSDQTSSHSHRRSLNLKSASSRGTETTHTGRSGNVGSIHTDTGAAKNDEDFLEEDDFMREVPIGRNSMAHGESQEGPSTARARRASEGAPLTRPEGKRASGDLKCEKCGKEYKHGSCLTKHLWEHTPEWSYTSKLLISKHQQVQLLEAASVLVGMNQDTSNAPQTAKTVESDHSSASPDASGSSELHDDYVSSAETTPPPMNEQSYFQDGYKPGRHKRHSGNSSVFSRSYQSAPSSSILAGSDYLSGTSLGQRRPSTSGALAPGSLSVDDDEAGLAAAVESLCSFGTPRTGPVHLPADVPPVPPLPAQYASQNLQRLSGNGITPTQRDLAYIPYSTQRVSNERDNRQKNGNNLAFEDDDVDPEPIPHNRSDDEEEGVFGRMEE